MKKYLMSGALALAAGFFVTSCHDDGFYGNSEVIEQKVQNFRKAFKEAFGPIDSHQTWGFKQADAVSSGVASYQDWRFGITNARGLTRAAAMWNDNHSCNWESKLSFTVPSDAKDLTTASFTDTERNSGVQGAVYKIPETFEGELNLNGQVKFNNCTIYNLGTVTNITGANWEGVVTFYNVGTMTWNITSGQRHTIINTGTFTLANDANIGTLYNNGGHLEITDTDISNSVTINSTGGTATINMPNGGDFKAAADIHGTLTSDKNVKIQNSNKQYICGIKVDGTLDLTQGKLESSNIEATHIKFDGDELWLLAGGHVKANTMEVPNGGCYIHGEASSVGFIEVGNITFKNDNDLSRTFSDNIYFKITGYIDCSGATNLPGGNASKKKYDNADAYLAQIGAPAGRLNAGNVTGNPACGDSWTIGGTGTQDPEPDPQDPEPDPQDPPTVPDIPEDWTDDTKPDTLLAYKYFEVESIGETGRIFCEDLGSNYSSSNRQDLDYNDVVFNVQIRTRDLHCEVTKTITIYDVEPRWELVTDDNEQQEGVEKQEPQYVLVVDTVNIREVTEVDTIDVTNQTEGYPRSLAKIDLYAAGGTLPLTVAGIEVHEAFGVGVTTMVNTRDANTPTVNGASTVARDPVTLINPNPTTENDSLFEGYTDANQVPVRVLYDSGDVMELRSQQGDAPHKIKVRIDTQWASERCYLGNAYPDFAAYVGGKSIDWESNGNQDYLYNPLNVISTEAVGETKTIKSESVTEYVLYENTQGYDITNGLFFTNRNLLINQNIQAGDKFRFYVKEKPTGDWCIFLSDGNSQRLHADTSSLNGENDYAEVTLTEYMVNELRRNNQNNAMSISGWGVLLTRVTLIKK